MKQTAVEWFAEITSQLGYVSVDILEQAKEMEKEQILETWHNGYNNQSPMIDEENCGEQYYKEIYKQD